MTRLFLFLVGFLIVLQPCYSQVVPINRETFAASYSAAHEKASEFPRKHDSQLIQLSDGRIEATLTWKWEYASEFKSRLVFEERSQKGFIRFEMLNLEDKTFCKIGDGAWTLTVGTCSVRSFWTGTQLSRMMNANASSEFSMEIVETSGQKLKKYREIGKLGKRKLPSGNEARPSFYVTTFWVDPNGRIIRQEYENAWTDSKIVTSTWVDTFTYLPAFNLNAPIKA